MVEKLRRGLLQQIHTERRGDVVERGLLTSLLRMLSSLGIYAAAFEVRPPPCAPLQEGARTPLCGSDLPHAAGRQTRRCLDWWLYDRAKVGKTSTVSNETVIGSSSFRQKTSIGTIPCESRWSVASLI